MDYSVGSRIRVRLYSGKIVEAENNGHHGSIHWPKTADRLRQRDRCDQSRADYRSIANNIVRNQIQVGSTVLVRLHDGREVEAKVTKIGDSVVGRKVHRAHRREAATRHSRMGDCR
jgi:hypothetical protein